MPRRRTTKKTWGRKPNAVFDVGKCVHCNGDISSDMSFICYYHAKHEPKRPAHYDCYKRIAEEEQNAKSR